ncbi:MAG TPA: ABC transporter permease [Vicinamibacterales bacterium]
MWRFLLTRACVLVLFVLAASSALLLVTSLAPGDALVEECRVNPDACAAMRARFGLDRPLGERYVAWLTRAARLDFGESIRYGQPVLTLVVDRAVNSALLAFAALALVVLFAVPLGVIAGSGRYPRLATLIGALSLILLSLPPLLTSILLTFAAARTGWLPVGGMRSIGAESLDSLGRLADLLAHLAIPALALALPLGAALERVQANAVVEGRTAPHVLAARARGVSPGRLLWRELWLPTAAPVIAVFGLAAGTLLSGSLAVELVTGWPGLGRLMFEALEGRDIPLAAGCGAAAALFLAVWTTLSDLAGWWIDPRTRPGAGA